LCFLSVPVSLRDLHSCPTRRSSDLVTVRAVADEIVAAADLVKGSSRGLPMALVRGAGGYLDNGRDGAKALTRELSEDWFRYGHVEAVQRGLGVTDLPGSA